MGNQSSKPDVGTTPVKENKMVHRRVSVQALSHGGKAAKADASATTTSATAAAPTSQHVHKPKLQQHLQASSAFPEDASKNSVPMDVPVPTPAKTVPGAIPLAIPSTLATQSAAPALSSNYTPVSKLRPPRLPLPIADVQMPESPTLAPVPTKDEDVSVLLDEDPSLRRKSSMLSDSTQDDEEIGDELQPYAADVAGLAKVVPTKIEWRQKGDKVYVTGTFANWERKFRLHRSKSGNALAAILQLPPGTHHLKFIVDGEMKAADTLPTAVDFTNVLVNYIEVSADDIPRDRRASDRGAKPIPTHIHPPIVIAEDHDFDSGPETPEREEQERLEPPEEELPSGDFRQLMPQALIDMELTEDDPKYQQAVNVIADTPGPPSLPLFLGKSILNGVLPMKDDASVLTLPNYTVLNHLATSSIKNGVLATSVTTRYKRKYVTTIMYKPTVDVE